MGYFVNGSACATRCKQRSTCSGRAERQATGLFIACSTLHHCQLPELAGNWRGSSTKKYDGTGSIIPNNFS
eukprot:2747300-Amphidinium_carterae.1